MRRPSISSIVVGVPILLTLAAPAFSQYLADAQANLPSGGFRHSSSFMTNYYIYRSIGGETYLKGKEQERKWWCVWLCKRNVDKKADSILVENTYYAEVQPGIFASMQTATTCTNCASCTLQESAGGFVIKMNFPGENGGLLPIDGVISHHIIDVDGKHFEDWTAKGKHPVPPPIIL